MSRTTADEKYTAKALNLWNIESIRAYADRNGGQGHGRRLHVWRWDADVFKYGESCGEN